MRVLVCGGRDFAGVGALHIVMNAIHALRPVTLLIHGAARGADSAAANWARHQGIETAAFPADWDTHGKRAGYVRNRQMLVEGKPDLVVAFPGGRGTAMMCDIATKAGVLVIDAAPFCPV